MMYITKWLRLTPVVMFGLVLNWKLIPQLFGPDKSPHTMVMMQEFSGGVCKKYWWYYMLYIVTLKSDWIMAPKYAIACMGHLWYMSTEFQMFWFSPIIFLGYLLQPFLGMLLAFAGVCVGLITSAQVSANNFEGHDQQTEYYMAAAPRCGAYFIGILLGLICFTWE